MEDYDTANKNKGRRITAQETPDYDPQNHDVTHGGFISKSKTSAWECRCPPDVLHPQDAQNLVCVCVGALALGA